MHTIPDFPEFASLDINHKQVIQELTHHFPSYSDFNFISLFSWDTDAQIGLSMLNKNLVVRFNDYEDSSIFLSCIGTNQLTQTFAALFEYCKQQALPVELRLVPHSVVQALSSEQHDFIINESRDNHDYILSVKKIREFGADYKRKRKAVNRFTSRYGETTWHGLLDLGDPHIIKEIRQVMQDWKTTRKRANSQDDKEFVAINRTLQHAENIEIQAYGIRIDNTLVAFTLFEIAPQKDVAVFHFTKANVEFEGIFEFLKHSLAKYLDGLGIEFINIEQDLGVEGLRITKESYRPVTYLKKYIIKPKE